MFSKRRGLLENANLDFAEGSACFVVGLDQLRKFYRSGKSPGATSDEQNIHRNRFCVWRLVENQPLQWKRRLMPAWQNAERTIRH